MLVQIGREKKIEERIKLLYTFKIKRKEKKNERERYFNDCDRVLWDIIERNLA